MNILKKTAIFNYFYTFDCDYCRASTQPKSGFHFLPHPAAQLLAWQLSAVLSHLGAQLWSLLHRLWAPLVPTILSRRTLSSSLMMLRSNPATNSLRDFSLFSIRYVARVRIDVLFLQY